MDIFLDIVLILAGFVLLIKGADFFVDGAASLARKLKIPSLVVGLTIVALGTSCPELAVSVSSSLSGANSMAIGNVVGSNLFNLLVVLGVCAAITPVAVSKDVIKRDFPVSIGVMIVFGVLLLVGSQAYT
ncbi:MAG: sodium:calcium antiporter, partial [Oscillospiraceae bacterium]|nr:sodium:calcium antiporter [Oscillospiraceae bacterium]